MYPLLPLPRAGGDQRVGANDGVPVCSPETTEPSGYDHFATGSLTISSFASITCSSLVIQTSTAD